MVKISFRVYGMPRPQGSMTAFVPKGWTRPVITHKNKKELLPWREAVKQAALAVSGGKIMQGPVHAEIRFYMPIPKSKPKELKTPEQRRRWTYPTTTPDKDKLVRAVYDALTKVVFEDDKQVVSEVSAKLYGERPGVEVTLEELA